MWVVQSLTLILSLQDLYYALIAHVLTRFLKNNVEAGDYFRRLNKNGSGNRN